MLEMSDDILVKVENVSKKFCRDLKKSLWYGIKDIGSEIVGRNNHQQELRPKEFFALQDISFELKRGEVLGLLGRNGAGKTTLLKLLNGLIKPEAGQVTMRGSVGALIALGTGFNPILTGRENIYINGSVLGLSKKEIDEKFDEIVNFADLWDFIDTPVQSYSSGMHVRLGFAVATNLAPDILMIDEILAVGDAQFRNKCYNQIGKMANNAAVIFVSHNMNDIARICDKCLVLSDGLIVHNGNVEEGISKYLEDSDDGSVYDDSFEKVEYPVKTVKFEWSKLNIDYGETIELSIYIETDKEMKDIGLQIPFYDNQSMVAGEWYSKRYHKTINLNKGLNELNIKLGPLYLKKGLYKIAIILSDSMGIGFPVWSYKSHTLKVNGPTLGAWPYQIMGVVK